MARYFVLFRIDLETRRIEIAGIIQQPERERFVRSVQTECLAQIIPLGERHLRHAATEYTEHYHVERNHQGIDNRLIVDQRGRIKMNGGIERGERLGGMLTTTTTTTTTGGPCRRSAEFGQTTGLIE